jgi:6-phosphofructokinase 2
MSAIVTITFSPCIDRSISVEKLLPEIKLQCSSPKLEPGGGGINVARAINKLGGNATAIYPSGGYTGKFLNKLLVDENVPSIIIETENETRENTILSETSTSRQFRFGVPGTLLKMTEWTQLLKQIEAIDDAAFIVASGSLAPGVPDDILARISAIAKSKKIKLAVDSSGAALKHVVGKDVFLLKPNLRELSALIGVPFLQAGEIIPAAKKVIRKGGCEIMVVSMGSDGAIVVTSKIAKVIIPPPVKVKSTVGAGDSMVAGIVLALSREEDIEAAAQYGVACGSAATMNPGTELCHKQDADMLFKQILLSSGCDFAWLTSKNHSSN